MQGSTRKKEALLDFLDKKVFEPVLEAIPELYSSERDRRRLQAVKEDVKEEWTRFHCNFLTAEEIKNQYFRELYFEGQEKLGKELEDLELPRFRELRSEFVELCKLLRL
jgi:hypothetical protein